MNWGKQSLHTDTVRFSNEVTLCKAQYMVGIHQVAAVIRRGPRSKAVLGHVWDCVQNGLGMRFQEQGVSAQVHSTAHGHCPRPLPTGGSRLARLSPRRTTLASWAGLILLFPCYKLNQSFMKGTKANNLRGNLLLVWH